MSILYIEGKVCHVFWQYKNSISPLVLIKLRKNGLSLGSCPEIYKDTNHISHTKRDSKGVCHLGYQICQRMKYKHPFCVSF